MNLDTKVACVTGGNSGIGRAIVVELANQGAAVVVNYVRDPSAAEALVQQITEQGGKALAVQGDVTRVEDIQKLIDQTVQAFGRLDIMVNNAGIETRTSLLDTTEHDFDFVMAVNIRGAFFGTQLAARQMIKQGSGGRIINISSVHEDWPMPGNTPYCCSKGALRMLARTAGIELAPHGVTVVNVGPGAVITPINRSTLDDPQQKAALEHAIPEGRIARPEEVAGLVAWLASDRSSYVTATTFFIDGGIMQSSPGL
jgi:glucose 1-dehydrogenase